MIFHFLQSGLLPDYSSCSRHVHSLLFPKHLFKHHHYNAVLLLLKDILLH